MDEAFGDIYTVEYLQITDRLCRDRNILTGLPTEDFDFVIANKPEEMKISYN